MSTVSKRKYPDSKIKAVQFEYKIPFRAALKIVDLEHALNKKSGGLVESLQAEVVALKDDGELLSHMCDGLKYEIVALKKENKAYHKMIKGLGFEIRFDSKNMRIIYKDLEQETNNE